MINYYFFIGYIASFEDLSDRINIFHINIGYGGNVKLRMTLQKEYYVPRPAIEIFLTVCQTCNSKNQ